MGWHFKDVYRPIWYIFLNFEWLLLDFSLYSLVSKNEHDLSQPLLYEFLYLTLPGICGQSLMLPVGPMKGITEITCYFHNNTHTPFL